MRVDLGGVHPLVAEPQRDHGSLDAGVQELHRGGVSERVQRHVLGLEGRAAIAGSGEMLGETALQPVAAQPPAAAVGEQRLARLALALGEPGAQDRARSLGQRRDALHSPLSAAAHVRAALEVRVAARRAP
ncbi:MAG TPA: hypothetical protein VKU89_10150 [Solirubrobacteraceae bacterium]|nr:hypothetical protein [Solirubrobacteraceae bacterium]